MNDLGTSAGLPDPPDPPERPQAPPAPPPPHAPPPYRAAGLIPGAGSTRTRALAVIGVPLLAVVVIGIWAGSGSGGSGGSGAGTSQNAPVGAPFGTTSSTAPGYQQPTATPAGPSGTDTPGLFGTPTTAPYGTATPTGTDAGADGTDSGAAGTPGSPTAPSASATTGPAEVVTDYYAAINSRDFKRAWALGGKNIDATYAAFVDGFSHTSTDTVTIPYVTGGQVAVTVDSLQTDGTRRSYTGSYQVAGGVITGGRLVQVS